MSDQENPSAETAVETPTTTQAPAKVKVPRAELTLTNTADGEVRKITGRYPMPVKAPRFNLTINGEPCEAAHTSGKGLDYTHFNFSKTGFFILGHYPADSVLNFSFPEGYPFDDEVKPRPSWVKRQEAKAAKEATPEWKAAQAAKAAAAAAKAEAAAAAAAAKAAAPVATPTDPDPVAATPVEAAPVEDAPVGKKARRR